jgi:hypothetical protein
MQMVDIRSVDSHTDYMVLLSTVQIRLTNHMHFEKSETSAYGFEILEWVLSWHMERTEWVFHLVASSVALIV